MSVETLSAGVTHLIFAVLAHLTVVAIARAWVRWGRPMLSRRVADPWNQANG